jgi:hypothetical protein
MNKVDAIVIHSGDRHEVRCAKCGKLLFKYKFSSENLEKPVDKSSRSAIIVTRCTRNDCKADNILVLS